MKCYTPWVMAGTCEFAWLCAYILYLLNLFLLGAAGRFSYVSICFLYVSIFWSGFAAVFEPVMCSFLSGAEQAQNEQSCLFLQVWKTEVYVLIAFKPCIFVISQVLILPLG